MKIGLIAMSGIRACDPELLRMGLTLPGFVERSKVVASMPSLGLLTLAGMTPKKHDIHYVEVRDLADVNGVPDRFDLVAISSFSAQINEAYELAQRYKNMGVPVVMGGLHVTTMPDEALQFCDAVIIGEGEPCWLQVLQDAEASTLQRSYDARNRHFDLADAPMPSFDLLDIGKYNRLTVQTSRGCPFQCEFCASSILLTKRYKQKPISKVLQEIERIHSLWKDPFIEFADDNTFVNHQYWQELLNQLKAVKGRRMRWFAETDISVAEDTELLDLMRETGCAQVLIGLESPVQEPLHGLELHSDWKFKKFPQYKKAIQTIQSRGITVNGCFILGLDGQNTDIFDEVLNFVKETELYEVQITVQTPFPGTPLYARLERENRLIEPRNWKKCTGFDINFQPARMSVKELDEGFKRLVTQLYSEEFTNWRRRTFRERLRHKAFARRQVS